MMKSLYSGVSGLKIHNQRMDVIGNNIANVNTTAYKASTVTFKDIFYQNKSNSTSGDVSTGGRNANQVGYGGALGTIGQVMTNTGFTYSDLETDCGIQGEGFFQVMNEAGEIMYTRAGVFHIDDYGNLTDPSGNIVLGVNGDPTGVGPSSQRINLYVPSVDDNAASVTKTINGYNLTVSASTFGEQGNISLAIQDGDFPFAVQNGSTITVTMDLDREFRDEQEFADAVNEALGAGGVTLEEGVLPLKFEFEIDPPQEDIPATSAINVLTVQNRTGEPTENEGTTVNNAGVNFVFSTDKPGEFGNSYQVQIRSTAESAVTARWSEDLLIISIPESGTYTEQQIQDALNTAAGMKRNAAGNAWDETTGNAEKKINVDLYTATAVVRESADGKKYYDYGIDRTNLKANTADAATNVSTFMTGLGCTDIAATATNQGTDVANYLDGGTAKVGLTGARDNFYVDIAQSMGTIKLDHGRVAAEQTTQDLKSIYIDDDGVIYGVHEVHGTIAMGRIDLVTFENPEGLEQIGTSYWVESLSSGAPEVKMSGEEGAGKVVSGALEMSNVDLSQEFSDMIITQRGFQANSRIITVSDTMLEELINLKR